MTLPDQTLRERLAKQEWTAHNIRLSAELTTMPNKPDFVETDMRLHAILRILSVFYRGSLAGLRMADLGCLEGGFTLALAQHRANVVGIEARQRNIEKCLLLQEHFELPDSTFLRDDVKNFTREKYGLFDVVMALGILYHLDQPVTWLNQIALATKSVLIVESHYAPVDDDDLALLDPGISKLDPLESLHAGQLTYLGRWFTEYVLDTQRENMLWASYSNKRSFWLTRESLLLAMLRSGFDIVLEEHDYTATNYQFYTTTFPRSMFVAVKSDAFKI